MTRKHVHDWYVLDLCRDYCRICTALKRACPKGHRHSSEPSRMTPPERSEVAAQDDDLLEAAWGIIANANSGNWSKQSKEWQEAARRWRAQYFDRGPVSSPGTLDNDREIAHLLSSTITEAALAGVSLGAYERRDLARLARAAVAEPLRGALDVEGLAKAEYSVDQGNEFATMDDARKWAQAVATEYAALEATAPSTPEKENR